MGILKERKDDDFNVYLTPLKQNKILREMGFYTFDTETEDGLVGKRLYCWGLAYRDQAERELKVLQGGKSLEKLFKKLAEWKDKQNYKVIFVHNLDFDARFLIRYCAERNIRIKPILSGSKMIALVIDYNNETNEGYNVKFIDTVQFLKTSQEKAEIEWEIESKYRKIDCKDIFEKPFEKWSRMEKKRVIEHNENDVKALHEIMQKVRKTLFEISNVDILGCVSLAGLSMKAFRKKFPFSFMSDILIETTEKNQKVGILNPFIYLYHRKDENNNWKRPEYCYDDIAERFVRSAYYGGRTEGYIAYLLKKMKYDDRHSMYPKEMHDKPYPIGNPFWLENNKMDKEKCKKIIMKKEWQIGFIHAKVESIPMEKYPVLPKRIEQKVMFMQCEIQGIYTTVELQYYWSRLKLWNRREKIYETDEDLFNKFIEIMPISIESNQYENQGISNIVALIFPHKMKLFDRFVETFYEIKKSSKGGKKQMAKILMNGLYGKFGEEFVKKRVEIKYWYTEMDACNYQDFHEKPEEVKLILEKDTNIWISMESVQDIKIKSYMNIAIAAFITAYSRLALLKQIHKMERKGIMVAYCDTDSITIPFNAKFKEGKELGQWAMETYFEEVKFLAPKAYISKQWIVQKDKNDNPIRFCGMVLVDLQTKIKLKGVDKRKLRQIEKMNLSIQETEKILRKKIKMDETYRKYRESHRYGQIVSSKIPSKEFTYENLKRKFTKEGWSEPWNKENIPEKFIDGLLEVIL